MGQKTREARRARIEEASRRIQHWRQTREKRSRMPEPLWDSAVALAREYGLYATAQGLRVSYSSLKTRVMAAASQQRDPGTPAARFVELGSAGAFGAARGAGATVVELTGSDGQKLTLRLASTNELDLPALLREFWGRQA